MSYTYSAFISYRHLPTDAAAAKAVQRALETFRIPREIRKRTGRKKLNRCFRDQDEMPLADDLGASIKKALNESEWLVVICTPDLPLSPWCLREVEYFIGIGRKAYIIPVLVTGEPKISFPPQLFWRDTVQGPEESEPLAADLRGRLRRQLKTEKLRIIARMLNLNYNDLKKRERERALRRGLVLVSTVLAAALCFTGYALYQNQILTEERNRTARNATQLLIEKSVRSAADRDLGNAMSYALQAYDGSRIFGAEYDEDIGAALEAAMYPEAFTKIGALKDNGILHRGASLSNDGNYIACRQSDNSLQVYSSVSGERLYLIRDFGWYRSMRVDLSPDSRYVCRFSEDALTLYDIADGRELSTKALPEGWHISFSGLTVRDKLPVRQEATGAAALFDPFTGDLTVLDGVSLPEGGEEFADMHRSGRRLFWSDGARGWIVDTETETVLRTLEVVARLDFSRGVNSAGSYTTDGWYLRYWNGGEYVYLRWDNLEEVYRNEALGALSPDGTLFATAEGCQGFTLWSVQTGEALWTEGHNSGNVTYGVAFVDDDILIANHSEIQIYRIHDRATVYDSGKDRTTYGYDLAAGRLVMPLQAGGCLVNLLPEENGELPHLTVETRESYPLEALSGLTVAQGLSGTWDGRTFWVYQDGQWLTYESDEEGLHYQFEGQDYTLHPVNGVTWPMVFISPDGTWQAMIRDEEVDVFRAKEGPEPVLTIPGNGYQRLCAAISGDTLAIGSYVENLILYDLKTGDCLGGVSTGAMCREIQFSPDGKHIMASSAMAETVTVANTQNFAVIMRIPVTDIYADLTVGFNAEGTEATVVYPDGHADVGLLYEDLDTLVEKARSYTN